MVDKAIYKLLYCKMYLLEVPPVYITKNHIFIFVLAPYLIPMIMGTQVQIKYQGVRNQYQEDFPRAQSLKPRCISLISM